MTRRVKFILYLLLVHTVFAGVVVVLLRENRIWLLALEVFFALSGYIGYRLLRTLTQPLELAMSGSDLLNEADFTARFLPSGQVEFDRLVAVYNRMVDHLREERIQLQELNYFLDRLIAASPSGILICDFDGAVALVNPGAEHLLGIPAAQLRGHRLSGLPVPFADSLHAMETGAAEVFAYQGRRRLKVWKSQFLDRGFPRIFLTLGELTEELRQSEKSAYEKLIRITAHEVGNTTGAVTSLLASCLNYGCHLQQEDRQDFEEALRVAIKRADHLNAFVRSFADVVRLPEPERRPCDVRALLEDLEPLLQAECRRRRIAWQWKAAASLPLIRMDRCQMEQVFFNVLKNAMEAIGEDGAITIHLGTEGKTAFVTIEDTGCALTEEIRSQVFMPFFSTKAQGHGIGLTLVQEILDRHGFDFYLDGGPGKRTRFTIRFDAAPDRALLSEAGAARL